MGLGAWYPNQTSVRKLRCVAGIFHVACNSESCCCCLCLSASVSGVGRINLEACSGEKSGQDIHSGEKCDPDWPTAAHSRKSTATARFRNRACSRRSRILQEKRMPPYAPGGAQQEKPCRRRTRQGEPCCMLQEERSRRHHNTSQEMLVSHRLCQSCQHRGQFLENLRPHRMRHPCLRHQASVNHPQLTRITPVIPCIFPT